MYNKILDIFFKIKHIYTSLQKLKLIYLNQFLYIIFLIFNFEELANLAGQMISFTVYDFFNQKYLIKKLLIYSIVNQKIYFFQI